MKVKEFEIQIWIHFESIHMQEVYFGFAQAEEVNESQPMALIVWGP